MRGIIFDLDGVICFTDQYHFQAWKEIADALGIPFDEEVNHRLRGISRADSLEILLESYEGEPISDKEKYRLTERKNEIYRELLRAMSPRDVSGEVRDTLTTLKRRGYKLALGSSSRNAKFILRRTDTAKYFDAVSDGTNIEKSKPDPEVFLKAAQYLRLLPEACLVVEDARAGIEAGNAAGMRTAAIGDACESGAADFKLDRISDLLCLKL